MRLKLWLAWLLVTTLFVLLFLLDTAFFASAMICQAANLLFGSWLMLRRGLVRLLGLSHILFWTPMFAKFWWHYDSLVDQQVLVFGWLMMATVAVSLVLDIRDYRDWQLGNRNPVGAR
ncbi:hypothetical protein [uncultured Roseobacter sp.]|uniref:hypothetical protein n=1 Tax=uncultured Roseobacter sp. TaxID=114847 RepID=UPI00260878AB|nr:hypothetical protein [uncultured Roseobacter sp.]